MLLRIDVDTLEFLSDPAEFLTVAGDRLAEQPVVSTVVATIAQRVIGELAEGIAQPEEDWWLFELGDLVEQEPVAGRLRVAGSDDAELTLEWFSLFMDEADEQAGRPRGTSAHEVPRPEDIRQRIEQGCVWFWVDQAGERVHMTAANPPSLGVARIGQVFTPKPLRGRGYASAAVAEVSRLIRDAGSRVCLFTDQANPTSKRINQALGYRRVVDMANLVIL